MSRCTCCNAALAQHDLRLKEKDGSQERFCAKCRWYAYNSDYLEVRTYAFEDLTEKMLHSIDTYYEDEENS